VALVEVAGPRDRHNPAAFSDLPNLCAPRDRYNRPAGPISRGDSLKSGVASGARPA